MATAKPNQKIHVDKLSATLEKLEQLEEKQKDELTLRESIYFLRDKLKSAFKKGYSYQDLSEILEEQGILVSAATLKQYLTESNKEAVSRKRVGKTGQKKKSSSLSPEKATREEAEISKKSQNEANTESLEEIETVNQSKNKAQDTDSFNQSEVELTEDNNQTLSAENQPGTKKTARRKLKDLSSSNEDLSSEFNQY